MVFSSLVFVFIFLPLVLFIHTWLFCHLQKKYSHTIVLNAFLFICSLLFYAWGEPQHLLVLLICTLATFHIGIALQKKKTTLLLYVGISVNLAILLYYKYGMLIIGDSLQAINVLLPNTLESSEVNISLPLGVSFYVFQAASYLIDVYRKEVAPSRNIINFGCYLTMFPQLVAGPIVRYSQIADELITRHISLDNCAYGISRFIIGLAKKILIADTLGRVADAAFTVPNGALSAEGAWIGLICYAFQIYFDFSGYSDMAIGIGRMLGFTFPENFNYPYSADSIQNFWKRWHMSLSTWFQDYLYIPLGGNRKGTLRTYLNLIVVFLLCGFWHGANWTFMAWGGYYGVFLVLERAFPSFYKRIPKLLKHIYVIVIVFGGWVLFRSERFIDAMFYYKSLLGHYADSFEMNSVWLQWHGDDVTIALFFASVFSFPIVSLVSKVLKRKEHVLHFNKNYFELTRYILLILIYLVTFMPLYGASYNSFIYFKF